MRRYSPTYASVFIVLVLVLLSQTGFRAWAQTDFIDVGDRPVTLGKLTFRPPPGWVRAPQEIEKSENAYLLGYQGTGGAADDLSLILSISRQTDAFRNETERKAYLKKSRKNLSKEGWTPLTIRVADMDVHAFETMGDNGERLFLALLPVKGRYYRFFFIVSPPESDLPESGRALLARVLAPESQPPVFKPHIPPSLDEIKISNILYTGDIDVTTPIGARTRQWQGEILTAMAEACRAFDSGYDRLRAANAGFDATVFDLHQRLKAVGVDPRIIRQEEEILSRLAELMALETALDAGIKEMRRQIKDLDEPLGRSLLGGHLQLTLLNLYTRAGQLQTTRAREIYSFYTVFHQTDLSPLDGNLRKKYSALIEKEAEAVIGALEADFEMQSAERAVTAALTGLKEVYRLSLELNLEFLEAGAWELEDKIRAWAPPDDLKVEAQAAGDALFLLRAQLQDLKQAKVLLDQAAQDWPGRIETDETSFYLKSPGTIVLASHEGKTCPLIHYISTAQSTGTTMARGDRLSGSYARAVRSDLKAAQKKEGFFGWMYRGVRNTVGAAANSFSMATKLAADKYYAYSEGISEKDARSIARQTVEEHMEEWDQGEIGRGAMRRAIQGFEAVENTAESTVEKNSAKIFGKGWTSWAAGKLANAAASTFTSLGKGVMQLSAHDATTGERVEGVINVASSLIGLSKNAAQPLTRSASQAVKKVAGQTGKTVSTIAGNRTTIAVEREIMEMMGETGTKIARKNIAKANKAMVSSLTDLRKAVATSVDGLKKGASDMIKGKGFSKEARKALTNLTQKDSFRNTVKKIADNLKPGNLPFAALDNAVAAKSGRVADMLTGEERIKKEREARKRRKKRKALLAEKNKDDSSSEMDSSDSDHESEDEADDADNGDHDVADADVDDEGEVDAKDSEPDAKPSLLDIVAPQRVTAGGVLWVPTPAGNGKTENVQVNVSISFWNVGAKGGSAYSGAVFSYVATNRGAVERQRLAGYFTGGPNGAIKLSAVTLSVRNGTTVSIPEMGSVPIQNPGAFADWP